jgi:2-polyprenyl-3-methyl-5-hydroxy-6-metoxy-1,4-benzoquinol methylase
MGTAMNAMNSPHENPNIQTASEHASPQVLSDYFKEQLSYDHDDHRHPPNTRVVIENQHALIRAAVARDAAKGEVHLLDIGCGWGDFSNQLDPILTSYIGVEPSLGELHQFHHRPGRSLIHGVGENLSYLKPASRNVILLNSVLDHSVDWRRTFDNCMRVLTPGGLVIISMENSEKLPIVLKQMLHLNAHHEGHLAFFTSRGTNEFLASKGFAVEQSCTIGFLYGFHQLTKKVPIPVPLLKMANGILDWVAKIVYPHGGHIFFVTARAAAATGAQDNTRDPFQCPRCSGPWKFGDATCPACGMSFNYEDPHVLKGLEFTKMDEVIASAATAG